MVAHPKVVIIGMPASGKTRVARELAETLDLELKDLDHAIEQRETKSIPEIFAKDLEEGFRKIETEILSELLTSFVGVLSLGGGAPISDTNQELLNAYRAAGGLVIYLDVHANIAHDRIMRHIDQRPLLACHPGDEIDQHHRWLELYKQRYKIYEKLADVRLVTGFEDGTFTEASDVAASIAQILRAKPITVFDENSESNKSVDYRVLVGSSLTTTIPGKFGADISKVAVFHTASVAEHLAEVVQELERAGYEVHTREVPDAESSKTIENFADCSEWLASLKFTRNDGILGFGGGAVTDLSGFLAATFLRGIKYINCPTSLLAMVDASVGGKTGINLESGKNLVGSFYSPEAVIIDVNFLSTLPERELIEGMGELTKIGFTFDTTILEDILDFDLNVTEYPKDLWISLIYRSIAVKAEVVSQDFKDTGLREYLNYGHTFGHAVEKLEHFKWRHGEAVAIGMLFVANLAFERGLIEQSVYDKHSQVLTKCGLPTHWKTDCTFDQVLDTMRVDKKTRSSTSLRFVALRNLAEPQILRIGTEGDDLGNLKTAFKVIVTN